MTHKEKVSYLRLAMALAKIAVVSDETADRIICVYEGILKKGGEWSLKDSVELELELDRKYHKKKLK